jgi:RNA polymerase sigma-70 factor (sigma-E family)
MDVHLAGTLIELYFARSVDQGGRVRGRVDRGTARPSGVSQQVMIDGRGPRTGEGTVTVGSEPVAREPVASGPTFDDLYVEAYPDMVRLAYLMVDSNGVAEELVQDSFVRVHAKWRTIDHPRAYLRTTVVNACRNERRRRKVARRVVAASRGEVSTDAHPDLLGDALRSLSPDRRAAIVLRFYEDLPVQDVADILGVAPGTVKSMVHRGLAELREVIDP